MPGGGGGAGSQPMNMAAHMDGAHFGDLTPYLIYMYEVYK
jgi:hypothetical protein